MEALIKDLTLTHVQWLWFGICLLFAVVLYVFLIYEYRAKHFAFISTVMAFNVVSFITWERTPAQFMLVMFMTMIIIFSWIGHYLLGGETPQ